MLYEIELHTKGDGDTIDLTREVEEAVEKAGVSEGAAIVFVPGSTASITTVENEPGMISDLKAALDRLVPKDARYAHNHGGESNGYAHVRSAIVGPSVAVPVAGGRPALGTWQQIVLLDFDDRPRSRRVLVHVLGSAGSQMSTE